MQLEWLALALIREGAADHVLDLISYFSTLCKHSEGAVWLIPPITKMVVDEKTAKLGYILAV